MFILLALFMALTIISPKIDLGVGGIYPITLMYTAIAPIYVIAAGKVRVRVSGGIIESYTFFMIICLLAWLVGFVRLGTPDFVSLMLWVEYLVYITAVYLFILNRHWASLRFMKLSIATQVCAIGLFTCFVIYNMVAFPIPVGDLIWGYSPQYRMVGFTGQALSGGGLVVIGNTSVQMGVFSALIGLTSLALAISLRKKIYIAFFVISVTGLLFTYSRSGFLVLLVGLLYLVILNWRNKHLMKVLVIVGFIALMIGVTVGLEVGSLPIGVLGKFELTSDFQDASSSQRMRYWLAAADFISNNGSCLLLGCGYGEEYTYSQIRTPHLESLVLTTLYQVGLAASLLLVLHFFLIWRLMKKINSSSTCMYLRGFSLGFMVFMPGFFVANLVGGNSLQTDFIAPIFYGLLGCIIARSQNVSCYPRNLKNTIGS